MIERLRQLHTIQGALHRHPIVGLLGARQVGKTTLARLLSARTEPVLHLDLEDPTDLARLDDPMLALRSAEGLVVLDEIQRLSELFPVLRVLVDRPESSTKFLLLGSAAPELLRQASESLAGRIHYHELSGLSLDEVGAEAQDELWVRGGFPRAFLAGDDEASAEWRRDFITAFLERDIPQLGIRTSSVTLRRFWTMVAHYHGQVWNNSEFTRSFGVAHATVRGYLDTLTSTLMLRQLQPWHENLRKRQVKSPKIYVRDSGLLHSLLGLRDRHELLGHPKLGASFEGFALEQVVSRLGLRPEECYFWATHAGAELDLLAVRGQRRWGFEFKHGSAPKLTRSMRVALEDLKLDGLTVVYPGLDVYPMAENVTALPIKRLWTDDLQTSLD
ncbi:MAG: ATP-binding protein [Acidobacteriota bacterium]